MDINTKVFFHKHWLNEIRIQTGASHVSHMRYKDNYYLKVILDKTILELPIGGTPDDIKTKDYVELINNIRDERKETV